MHSRIIQLSKKPIDKEEYIKESDFFGYDGESGFVGTIADYVNEHTNTAEDIKWFVSCYEEYGVTHDEKNGTLTFKKGFLEKYFKERFEQFKELSSNLTMEEFTNSFGMERYRIEKALEDTFGFYIYIEDYNSTMDTFARMYLKSSNGDQTFYTGNTIDYHF